MAKKGLRSASFGSPVTLRFRKRFEDHIMDLTSQSIQQSLSEIEAVFDSKFAVKAARRNAKKPSKETAD